MMIEPGAQAPDFALPADDGSTVRLGDLRGRNVVIFFYPRDDTPGCTIEAREFGEAYPRFQALDTVVLGISTDGVESHVRFRTKFGLPYPLLVDEGHAVADAYGVWGGQRNVRSHFVIDENGNLADLQIQVTPEDSVARALQAIAG